MRRLAIVVLAAVTGACALITSFDGFDTPKPGAGADAADADAGSDGGDASSCAHATWPPPPAGGAAADVGRLVGAARSMSFVSPGATYGFDLDALCTCPEKAACIGAQPGKPCDADGGVDNATTDLFTRFSLATNVPLDNSGLALGLSTGHFGVVFDLSGWNGAPDDPEVALAVYDAFDVNPGTDAGARFDGTDRWVLDEASVVDGKIPVFLSTNAYVSGGELVARFARLGLKTRIPTVMDRWILLDVDVRDAHVAAKVSRDGAGLRLAGGVIAGRATTASLIAIAASAGACPGSETYRSIESVVCDARDVPLDPAQDGRDAPCGALSVGVSFEAGPAKIAPDAGTPTEFEPCADAAPPGDCK